MPFRHDQSENWSVEVEVEQGREYRFRYLIDGEYWGYDWRADKHIAGENGVYSSVVVADLDRS